MKILITGSAGHLGEGLMRRLEDSGHAVVGIDITSGRYTSCVGSITDRAFIRNCSKGVDAVIHTATLHKPHLATHDKQQFVDTNVAGTLTLLEEAVAAGARSFVFTSTTSAFGAALTPAEGAPAAWIDETVSSIPKNIYGVTKTAAEDLCHLFSSRHGLNCIVLRTSRFFPEEDDSKAMRDGYADANAKANEFLFRRVDLDDVVSAHAAALGRAAEIGFGRYVISATTPFRREDLGNLRRNPADVVERRLGGFLQTYRTAGYRMLPSIDRVYVNTKARTELGWEPRFDFERVLGQISNGEPIGSALARAVGSKGYHDVPFEDGPYPVE